MGFIDSNSVSAAYTSEAAMLEWFKELFQIGEACLHLIRGAKNNSDALM